jgi:glucokinase
VILAGDIGGTSTRLALFEVNSGKLEAVAPPEKFRSADHKGLDEIVAAFVAARTNAGKARPIEHAAFGIAGPIRDGKVRTSNLPWVVDAARLAAQLKVADVHLLNDLEANAYGIAELTTADLVTLNEGVEDRHGNDAVISAGTGLGEAGVFFDGSELHPFACEGGHADFAPRDELEIELLRHLQKKFASTGGHVSYERVLSGQGLVNIYEFLRDTGRGEETPEVAAAMKSGDPAAAISKAALDGSSPTCLQALDMLVSIYGAEAGNLALKIMATRGIYIGGGIAPKIIRKLQEPRFMKAFCDKGRLKPVLQLIPVRVITNDLTALLGAARYAAVEAGLLRPWLG